MATQEMNADKENPDGRKMEEEEEEEEGGVVDGGVDSKMQNDWPSVCPQLKDLQQLSCIFSTKTKDSEAMKWHVSNTSSSSHLCYTQLQQRMLGGQVRGRLSLQPAGFQHIREIL